MSGADHATSPRARRKARDGERKMEQEREMASRLAGGRELADALDNVSWLFQHGALAGVGEIIRERRRQIESGRTIAADRAEYEDGRLVQVIAGQASGVLLGQLHGTTSPAEDESGLAEVGAQCAAEIDRLETEFNPEKS